MQNARLRKADSFRAVHRMPAQGTREPSRGSARRYRLLHPLWEKDLRTIQHPLGQVRELSHLVRAWSKPGEGELTPG